MKRNIVLVGALILVLVTSIALINPKQVLIKIGSPIDVEVNISR